MVGRAISGHARRCASLALLVVALLCAGTLPAPATARAPGAVLIWPVHPVIEADRRERDDEQREGRNLYAEQGDVVATPPVVTIAPGAKQLVRLTRLGAPPPRYETAYRIIVDEIPAPAAAAAPPGAAIAFRMRYSLPLFVRGAGSAAAAGGDPATPHLVWRRVVEGGEAFAEIRNAGERHARLTDVAIANGARRLPLAEGLLGYVLAGETMRWPLPRGADPAGELEASVNALPAAPIARAGE
jgi:fimbrial chaperone protein